MAKDLKRFDQVASVAIALPLVVFMVWAGYKLLFSRAQPSAGP